METPVLTIGQKCLCKVANNIIEATIIEANPEGFWIVENINTGKKIKICNIDRLTPLPCNTALQSPQTQDAAAQAIDRLTELVTKSDEQVPVSLIDAAAIILRTVGEPLLCTEIIDKAVKAGIWHPKTGKTPANTLYSSISREIKNKHADSRFRRSVIKGKFEPAD